jgi:tetratricopeptide (TPR) repeat protein
LAFRRDKALQAAQRFASRGEYDKAIREYQSIVENEPGDIQSWLMLADSLHRMGELDQAVERWVHAAELHLHAGDVPAALTVFRQVLDLAPERFDVHLKTAQAFEQARRPAEAVALYERVASVYLRSGNTREALMLYERVAELMPRDVPKRLRLAELYSRERRVDEAVQHFELGASVYWQAGQHAEFVRVAERLLYHRQVDHVLHQLVQAYLDIDQPRRALMKLNELLQRLPTDLSGLELLAETFVRLGKVDKAISVVVEIARTQREGAPEGKRRAFKAVRKASTWAPANSEITRLLGEFEAAGFGDAPDPGETQELEEFDEVEAEEVEEFEELDEVDEPVKPTPIKPTPTKPTPTKPTPVAAKPTPVAASKPAPVQARKHSLTEEVLIEGAQRGSEENEVDFDKQFEEVRVLMKYHLFEHALGHVDAMLRRSPRNRTALELHAEVLAGLDRLSQAADVRAQLAELLVDGDPQAAARQVELALALVPDHARAQALAARIAEISGVSLGRVEVEEAMPSFEDPLGDLDLADDVLGAIEASESLVRSVGSFAHDESDGAEPGSRNDSRADPLGDLDGPLAAIDEDIQTDALSLGVQRDSLDGIDTPQLDDADGIDIRDADPSLHGELNRLAGEDDFAISVDQGQDEVAVDVDAAGDGGFEDRFGLDDDDGEPEPSAEPPIPTHIEPEPTREAPLPRPEPVAATPKPVATTPKPAPKPARVFADLSAELDELQFFLAQDLEEDAVAAFEDLIRKHPGHPELAKLATRFPGAAGVDALLAAQGDDESVDVGEATGEVEAELDAGESQIASVIEAEIEAEVEVAGVEESFEDVASEPLLDLDDEDDGDFLANIFDADASSKRKQRAVAIQTHEVEGADAGDHFDLGTAYREMGLIDDALREYGTASRDPRWQAKSLVMMATLHASRGDGDAAIEHLQRAVAAARTKDERCESNYELAMNLMAVGRNDEARAALEQVDVGFREREDKLREL